MHNMPIFFVFQIWQPFLDIWRPSKGSRLLVWEPMAYTNRLMLVLDMSKGLLDHVNQLCNQNVVFNILTESYYIFNPTNYYLRVLNSFSRQKSFPCRSSDWKHENYNFFEKFENCSTSFNVNVNSFLCVKLFWKKVHLCSEVHVPSRDFIRRQVILLRIFVKVWSVWRGTNLKQNKQENEISKFIDVKVS